MMAGALAGGTAAVAGCIGSDDDEVDPDEDPIADDNNDIDDNTDSDAVRIKEAFQPGRIEFDSMHFNPYDPGNVGGYLDPHGLMFDEVTFEYPARSEFDPNIAKDWSVDGDVLEVEFRDDWLWQNGDPVTAQDYVTQFQLDIELQRIATGEENPHDWVESVEYVDDQFLRLHLHEAFDEDFVLSGTIGDSLLMVKHDLGDPSYQDHLDRLRDADIDDDQDERVIELFDWRQDEPIGNGLFELRDRSPNQVIFELFEDHPNADLVEIDEFEYEMFDDIIVAFQEGQADLLTRELPRQNDVMEQLPDHHETGREFIEAEMLCFNHGQYDHPNSDAPAGAYEPYTSDREVRKAIAYIVDRELVNQILPAPPTSPVTWPNSWVAATDWELDTYPELEDFPYYGVDFDLAEELLTEVGYEDDDGTWVDEEGEPMEIRVMTQSGRDIPLSMMQTVVDELNDFGIPAELEAVDGATFGERRFDGEYDIMYDGSGASSTMATWDLGHWDWLSTLHHSPNEYEVPMPIGDPDGGDGTETINIVDELEAWSLTGDSEHVLRCMWAWNRAVPRYEITYRPYGGGVNAENWDLDASEAVQMSRIGSRTSIKHPDASLTPKE